MTDSKARVAASIEKAKADWTRARRPRPPRCLRPGGDRVHRTRPEQLSHVATRNGRTATALTQRGGASSDRLAGRLHHLADLMQHTVGKLLGASARSAFRLKPDVVNVSQLMERACEYYDRVARGKEIKLVCHSVGDVPFAWADRVAVAVVADNLLSNAVKFSPSGGSVEVQSRRNRRLSPAASRIRYRVEPGGSGAAATTGVCGWRPAHASGPGNRVRSHDREGLPRPHGRHAVVRQPARTRRPLHVSPAGVPIARCAVRGSRRARRGAGAQGATQGYGADPRDRRSRPPGQTTPSFCIRNRSVFG